MISTNIMQVSPNVDHQVAAIQLTARVADDLAPAYLLPSLGAALQLLVRPPKTKPNRELSSK
jgi:hypothetical protein